MKKIYYLQKHEVKLGDVIEYNGIKTLVTEKLIGLNPELFIVKDPTQELLNKAKGITMYTPEDDWCEIIPFKFTTEDGVNIYGDMKTYKVYSNLTMCNNKINNEGTNSRIKYFYHKENALAYIEKHKEKTLEEYESNLFEIMQTNVYSSNNRHYSSVWSWIKDNEPKLYYTKILQLIADDLNDGWVADFSKGGTKWYISEEGFELTRLCNRGAVHFKTRELAKKARLILGDSVKHLFS